MHMYLPSARVTPHVEHPTHTPRPCLDRMYSTYVHNHLPLRLVHTTLLLNKYM